MKISKDKSKGEINPLKKALFQLERYRTKLEALKSQERSKDIAIIGMSLKFPGANTPEEYWGNLIEKKDHIISFPEKRKEMLKGYYDTLGKAPQDMSFQEGAYLDHIDHFDYDFFDFSKPAASLLHPLQRLFLETSWKALEDAGYLQVSDKKIGVYLGSSGDITYARYLDLLKQSELGVNSSAIIGNNGAVSSSRLSYFLNLKGPAITIDTACSSSLVAIHQAYNSLITGDSDIAIAGGGRLYITPEKDVYKIGFESPNNRTRPFDAASDGAGIGEGVAAIVMKPLDKALADNDHVYAVIKGSAINQDGTSAGITAPNPKSQVEVIKAACNRADIDIKTLSYIETHGTGTPLGDPIEFQALVNAFGKTEPDQTCVLGAVKSNLGHLFEASGIAGLIKCILSLQHKTIPASINHDAPNKNINFVDSPFTLNTESIPWETNGISRRCGVSSFGISGTNAHLILEEHTVEKQPEAIIEYPLLFTLSAKTKEDLLVLTERYNKWMTTENPSIQDVCYSTNVKTGNYPYRFTVIVHEATDLNQALSTPEKFISHADDNFQIDVNLIKDYVEQGSENQEARLEEIADEYKAGGQIDWQVFYRKTNCQKISLPTYPLKNLSCWPKYTPGKKVVAASSVVETTKVIAPLTYNGVYTQLAKMILIDTGVEMLDGMEEADFFDLGIDSIVMMQFIQTIKKEYGVKLEIEQFYREVYNLNNLTRHIVEHGNPSKKTVINKETKQKATIDSDKVDYFVPYKKIVKKKSKTFSTDQQNHLDQLSQRIIQQTGKSKEETQKYRKVLANNRNVAGFRPETKETTYQIIAKEAKGSKIIDLDGNEYVDLTMGFGVNLLGYNPSFIQQALSQGLTNGYAVGPMSDTAGKVAELITEMTGNERVAFYNSGSEAVMVALRLARAKTGRAKFVLFKESYHGTFDGVLALSNALDPLNPIPLAPGVSDNYIENTIVLEYGSKESLKIIEEHAHELAAVLIEPVQSRRPDLQPQAFIKELRKITKENGAALIFDEVITGFRIHSGGAQAYFDVDADLCTYGKIVGGGLPIGVVAGSSDFMDAVDGGHWQFGDDSSPNKPTTFVAGTFNQHPLTMISAFQVLSHLKQNGNQLQIDLNNKTAKLVERLNAFFIARAIPIKVVHFGSLFRFVLKGVWDLLFQQMLANKIYVWEGRNCFLSTAHTPEDVEYLYQNIIQSVNEMIDNGWVSVEETTNTVSKPQLSEIPLTEEQEQLYALAASSVEASSAFNENQIVDLYGELNQELLKKAISEVVNRHEALRTIEMNESHFLVSEQVNPKIECLKWEECIHLYKANDVDDFLSTKGASPFDLSSGPFIKFVLLEVASNHFKLLMTTHHLVADGYSIELIWTEISQVYSANIAGTANNLPTSTSLKDFNAFIAQPKSEAQEKANREFWVKEFAKKYPSINLPSTKDTLHKSVDGYSFSQPISRELKEQLTTFAKMNKTTLFNIILSAYNIMLYRLSNQSKFVIGVPSSGQLLMGERTLVGQCVKMLPFYNDIEANQKAIDYLTYVRDKMAKLIRHQQCSFKDLLATHDDIAPPRIASEIDMNSVKSEFDFLGLETKFSLPSANYAKYDLSVSIMEIEGEVSADFYFNQNLFDVETVKCWAEGYIKLLEDIMINPEKEIKYLSLEKEDTVFATWESL